MPANGLPSGVVDKLKECGNNVGPKALQRVDFTFDFNVAVTENGHVKDVQIREASADLPEVEECMASALYGLSASLEDMPLRQGEVASGAAVTPEQRTLLGQDEGAALTVIEVLGGGAIFLAGWVMYEVHVHYFVEQRKRHHHPPPTTAAPPAVPEATSPSMATSVPIATVAPIATAVPIATVVAKTRRHPKPDMRGRRAGPAGGREGQALQTSRWIRLGLYEKCGKSKENSLLRDPS